MKPVGRTPVRFRRLSRVAASSPQGLGMAVSRTIVLAILLLNIEAHVFAVQNVEHPLDLTISAIRADLKQGDEIQILFKITNKGRTPYKYDDRSYDRSGRLEEYSLIAHRHDGSPVPDPRADHDPGLSGGLSGGIKEIAPAESFEKTVPLNLWALVNHPGRYTVVGTYRYSLPDQTAQQKYASQARQMRAVKVQSQPIEITIAPRTGKEMAAYIAELTDQLKPIDAQHSREERTRRGNIVAKLAYTCDPTIVPTLIELIYSTGSGNDHFWAQEALRFYVPRTNEVRGSLVNVAVNRGLKGPMQGLLESYACEESLLARIIARSISSDDPDTIHSAVLAAQTHPDDSYMARLIQIAADDENQSQDSAISAIAYNRTDQGVQTLRKLLEDETKHTHRTAQDAIKQAYRRRPVRPRQIDREYTAALAGIAEDMNDSLWAIAVNQIIRTRTEEGIAALRAHLDDSAKGNTLIESDECLKAIRYWLRHSDPNIRSYVERYVSKLCKVPRGRPLRPDDFAPDFGCSLRTL